MHTARPDAAGMGGSRKGLTYLPRKGSMKKIAGSRFPSFSGRFKLLIRLLLLVPYLRALN